MNASEDRRRRVAILRSSRFLSQTIEAARARWPGADLRVVYQPGSEAEWQACGVPADAGLAYDEARFLRPWPFWRSRARRALRRWRPEFVVIQWVYPSGRGQQLLGFAALLVCPRGFEAFGSDGSWTHYGPAAALAHPVRLHLVDPVRRFVASHAAAVVLVPLVVLLAIATTPVWIVFRLRERLRRAIGAASR